ncbi:MAG TPA: alanine racemase, partial [Candidatus Polarisedimenticolaceae bacterium]|nr:alanine racemase [Candidatus Polarisedimenticolaceae bacterium]
VISLAEGIAALGHLDLRGLMIIPPPAGDPEESRPWFRRLVELRDLLAGRLGRPLPELSMGMTDDFETAVEEGATLVRVGRALFGERG